MTSEEIRQEAEEHCNEVMCTVCENKTCTERIKCREWRDRRAGYYCGAESRENKMADIKANCDYVLEDKDLEIKQLKMTDEYIIKTLESKVEKLQEDLRNKRISIKNKKAEINELKLELTVEKDQHQEEINLHLHAEDYIKSLEKENKTLEGCLLAEQEHTQMLEQQIEKMQEKLKADLIADLKERIQYSTSPSCTKGMELFIRSIEEWEIKENGN